MRIYALMTVLAIAVCSTVLVVSRPVVLNYYIEVAESGNATVLITVTGYGNGSFYIFLPKFEKWEYNVYEGKLIRVNIVNNTIYYFYSNVTFEFSAGVSNTFKMSINYNFPYASLQVDNKGWFMSPLIGVSPESEIKVIVSITNLGKIIEVTVNNIPSGYEKKDNVIELSISGERVRGGGRVTIDYELIEEIEDRTMNFTSIDNVTIAVITPPYYKNFALRIVRIIDEVYPIINKYLNYKPDTLTFKFFLPKRMDLSALGYVMGEDVNAGGEGPIHLNLALIRFKKGYLEATIVHELAHKALGNAGIPANVELRWFHEGVAQYAALLVCEKAGIDVSDERFRLEKTVEFFEKNMTKPGFVRYWNPRDNPAIYYAASYYIVAKLADDRGDLNFIKKVLNSIKIRGGVTTNKELIEVLSEAAGEDLKPLFKKWGFEIEDVEEVRPFVTTALVAIILGGVVTVALLFLLRGRRMVNRCPYCYAEVDRDAVYCPYCGYELSEPVRYEESHSSSSCS